MKKLIFLALPLLVYSCHDSIQDKIVKNIQKSGSKDSCFVKIVDVTSFDWDTMYVFGTSSSLENINEQLGFEYPYFVDIARRIIFTKSKKIVYHEEEYPDPEKKRKLLFSFEDTTTVMIFTRKTAVFSTIKESLGGWICYDLKPVK